MSESRFASLRVRLCWLAAVIAVAATGCGGSDQPRVAVSGAVDLDGQGVVAGTVLFHPEPKVTMDGARPTGTSVAAAIRNGKFHLPAEEGPPPGKARVEIIVQRDLGFALDDEEAFATTARGGGRPLTPVVPNVAFRDPQAKSVVLSESSGPLKFDLVTAQATQVSND